MLVARILINTRQIDEIYIHNTTKMDGDKHIYRIVDPQSSLLLTETTVSHKRDEGYRKLLIKVLEVIEDEHSTIYGEGH
jgi:hypothetical protein